MDTRIRILVVDDSSTMRAIIKTALRDHGFQYILEADDGDTALDILRSAPVDIVLCDWLMDRMNGIELLRTVRMSEGLEDIPFIMITSEAQRDNVIQAIKDGVSNYLIKPFQPAKLIEKMKKVLDV